MIFHVVPLDDWLVEPDRPFTPPGLDEDGSIPCCRDEEGVLAAADARFREARGPLMALLVDEERLDAKVGWEPGPRIYGRINRTAVAGMMEVQRDHEGRAVALGPWS